jgi:hypothetical protein
VQQVWQRQERPVRRKCLNEDKRGGVGKTTPYILKPGRRLTLFGRPVRQQRVTHGKWAPSSGCHGESITRENSPDAFRNVPSIMSDSLTLPRAAGPAPTVHSGV